MKSTRSHHHVSSTEAILQGLSQDGGLFVLDHIDSTLFSSLNPTTDYSSFALQIFSRLLDDYDKSILESALATAYGPSRFPNGILRLANHQTHSYLELYHGPTFAFKDMALSVLPPLFEQAKTALGIKKPSVILTATSGDTGGAALAGFGSLPNTHVYVLYPAQGISAFQEQQMTSYQSDTCKVIGVEGNFDDCQRLAKEIFHAHTSKHVLLSSANSINIGRIIPQIVYYMYAYHELVRTNQIQPNELINITVPTGNFGNIYAAYLAKRMGLPVHRLILASNKNDVLTKLFQEGEYNINRQLHTTISPSMDIVVSSNLERYLYHLLDDDPERLRDLMNQLSDHKSIQVPAINPNQWFYAGSASEEDTLREIRLAWETEGQLIDPHTAVARHVTVEYRTTTLDDHHTLIASTANPYKFADAIAMALRIGTGPTPIDTLRRIESTTGIPIDPRMLALFEQQSTRRIVSLEDAKHIVLEGIGDLS